MKVTITGATGQIGSRLVDRLRERGDEVTVLSRDPGRATARLGVPAVEWDALSAPAPAQALIGRDAVVHLAGEPVAQRWTEAAKRAIRDSRVLGTRNLVAGLRNTDPRPRTLVASSAVGYYGDREAEPLDESAPAGDDFLARVCVDWEHESRAAVELGLRVAILRTGVVLDRSGGALKTMLPPFRAGVGGPVAGGRQYVPWIHLDDVVEMYLTALGDERWEGPINATAPEPATNRELSRALGRALRRPAVVPVPGLALRLLYGEMSRVVLASQRAQPARARQLGFSWKQPELQGALDAALAAPRY